MKAPQLQKAKVSYRDNRGWTIDPLVKEDFLSGSPENLHVVSAAPGIIRANHYHMRQTEYVCMIGSRALVVVVDNLSGERSEKEIDCDEPVILKVAPNISHAIKNIGNTMMYLLCYTDLPYNPEQHDVVPRKILDE
jgi:dTDP-4-dehydrorhamnose 3,5-epimerase